MKVQFLRAGSKNFEICTAEVSLSKDAKVSSAFVLDSWTSVEVVKRPDPSLRWMHRGLMDSHLHVSWLGERRRRVIGEDYSKYSDYLAALLNEVAKEEYCPGQEILMSYGFDEERWKVSLEDFARQVEELLPMEKRWILYRVCGHSAFASRALLDELGMNTSKTWLDDRGIHELQAKLPAPNVVSIKGDYLEAQRMLMDVGISAVGDMSLDRYLFEAVKDLRDSGELLLDYQGVLLDKTIPEFQESGPLLPQNISGRHFEVSHWKRYLDGSFGSRTAWLRNFYNDNVLDKGLQLYQTEELIEASRKVLARGFALSFHAIGDAALEQIIELSYALEKEMRAINGQRLLRAHRIEHAQLVGKDQVDRLKNLDLWTVCSQPYHREADSAFIEKRLGRERLHDEAYILGSLVKANIPCSLGSDAPITIYDPVKTLNSVQGHPNSDERLPFEEALWLYSEGGRQNHGMSQGPWAEGDRVWIMEPCDNVKS